MLFPTFQNLLTRGIRKRNMSVVAKSLKYKKFGEPAKVLELVECPIDKLKDKDVLVEILAAPINPADINTIQGKYPIKPKLPVVGGNEFVGKVLCVGNKVKKIRAGQKVVPWNTSLGAWTTLAVFGEMDLMQIPDDIGLLEAATLTLNPVTAYRMLKDHVSLSSGDCVIQNGANSTVGQAVHQLCKAWNIKSVGIIRKSDNAEKIKNFLKCRGATEVLTEEEAVSTKIFEGCLPRPRLALNCIGGESASIIARHLEDGGVMVTFGGMSLKPVSTSTYSKIYRDIRYVGFWVTRWSQYNLDSPKRKEMFKELLELISKGKFWAPLHEMVPLEEYKEACSSVLDPDNRSGKKLIFDMLAS